MNICDINKSANGKKARKRVGRGAASGQGKTCGRGQKGLGQRAGANFLRGYIGGQTNLMTRLPKRGFNNAMFRTEYLAVNVAQLEQMFDAGVEVGPEELSGKGVTIRRSDKVKILGDGEISKGLTVRAHAFSKSAKEKIEKAGGKVEVIK